jgi:hypothetical protein
MKKIFTSSGLVIYKKRKKKEKKSFSMIQDALVFGEI